MHQMTYYYLILKYPTLRQYINSCWVTNDTNRFFDFLFALETDEVVKGV